MWSGSASTFVSLHPQGFAGSYILAASSTRQAGWTKAPGEDRWTAAIWSGTAASMVSLAPPNSIASQALAMTETYQGGFVLYQGQPGQGSINHAAMWRGTASTFVDLHPSANYEGSGIRGMFGNQQVGSAALNAPGSSFRAAMWSGSAESFLSMHPFSDGYSIMNATCGSAQVGYLSSVSFGAGMRAAIWFGTPESVMDLAQFLPPGHIQSAAFCIEERNGVFTVGGFARYGEIDQAFVWVGVPAPNSAIILTLSGSFVLPRRRRVASS
jgi:hypothetical protein